MKRFEFDHAMFREMIRFGVDEKEVRRTFKKIVSERVRKESVGDPYQISLMAKPRKWHGSHDGYVEYGLYELDEDQKSLSDQELEELVYDEFAIPEWHSPYDCTGKPFTEYISVHRNPCGLVSVVHHIGYDV